MGQRRARRAIGSTLAAVLLVTASAPAAADPTARAPLPWDDVLTNYGDAFVGPRFLLVSAAVGSTVALSMSGADASAHRFFAKHPGRGAFSESMVVVGYVAPLAIAGGLYAAGLFSGSERRTSAGAAAIQALALTFGTVSVLKLVTGRPFPLHGADPSDPNRFDHPEYAYEWNFMSPSQGWAWPSGHTACAVAVTAALLAHERAPWVGIVGYGASFAIGLGMLAGEHHWLSDVLAGALLGQAIGGAVGAGFRARLAPGLPVPVAVLPMMGPARGFVVTGVF